MTELEIILNTYFNTHIKVGDVSVWVKEIINKFLNTYGYSTTKQFASNGGKARANKLSKKQLSDIGKLGAKMRYRNKK